MNTMKKNGGFTLVELIIVIAILAILSTGAIAGYSAYIQSANDAAVNAVLGDISTSAVLANAKAGEISEITVVTVGNNLVVTVTCGANGFDTDTETGFAAMFKKSLAALSVADLTTGVDNLDTTMQFTVAIDRWENSKYKTNGATWSANEWSVTTTANP